MLGNPDRPTIARPVPDPVEPIGYDPVTGAPVYAEEPAEGAAIPALCLRCMSSPLPVERGGGCPSQCPGVQRDGTCLVNIVNAANEAGVQWSFEIDRDGFWVYDGEPIPGLDTPGRLPPEEPPPGALGKLAKGDSRNVVTRYAAQWQQPATDTPFDLRRALSELPEGPEEDHLVVPGQKEALRLLDTAFRVLACFGDFEGTWFEKSWSGFGITDEAGAAIKAAWENWYETRPL